MTSVDEAASIAPSIQKSRVSRGLGSRFGSLFSSKSGHVNDPQIELQEPHRVYARGDVVKGKVILAVAKSLGITHLTVSLFGYVEVFKHHSRNKAGLRVNPVRVASEKGKRWVTEYYGDGFASLFEHEATLCGEGRLDPNSYHFQFEMPFPSDRELPTSIEFERGVVAYGVAVTLTRPVTINPTITTSHPVKYRQTIDLATLRVPKLQKVTLEPINGHSRPRAIRRLTSSSAPNGHCGSSISTVSKIDLSRRPIANIGSINDIGERAPQSPVPSAPSSVSMSSNCANQIPVPSEPRSSHSSHDDCAATSQASSGARTISASFELPRSGALPGELVPILVQIQHTKAVRSLNGVIVTLYRQARVDMHPNSSSVLGDQKETKNEDYYPRSRTGLGGLSLSAAGSSQVWRKDLSQSISPLYIDENSMTAIVRPTIRIPEDVFTTLSNAPGDMIAFRYFVEVIIDINGKLGSRQNGSTPDTASVHSAPITLLQGPTGDDIWSPSQIVNDSATFYQPPATKGIVKLQCELVIGTHDSAKHKGKETRNAAPASTTAKVQEPHQLSHDHPEQLSSYPVTPNTYPSDEHYSFEYYDSRHDADYEFTRGDHYSNHYGYNSADSHHMDGHFPHPIYSGTHPSVPPPPNTSELSEKERMRAAEETLLPSQPPGAEQDFASSGGTPSAPYIPEESSHGFYSWQSPPNPSTIPQRFTAVSIPVPIQESAENGFDSMPADVPAPSYSATTGEDLIQSRLPSTDKQEAE